MRDLYVATPDPDYETWRDENRKLIAELNAYREQEYQAAVRAVHEAITNYRWWKPANLWMRLVMWWRA